VFKHRLKQDNAKALEQPTNILRPNFPSQPVFSQRNANTLELIANENPKLDTKLEKYLEKAL